jgi:hypothetical protein
MRAKDVLVRCKAEKIDGICDELLQAAKSDAVIDKIIKAKTEALAIVNLVEDEDESR